MILFMFVFPVITGIFFGKPFHNLSCYIKFERKNITILLYNTPIKIFEEIVHYYGWLGDNDYDKQLKNRKMLFVSNTNTLIKTIGTLFVTSKIPIRMYGSSLSNPDIQFLKMKSIVYNKNKEKIILYILQEEIIIIENY